MFNLKIEVPPTAFVYDKTQLRRVLRAAGAEVAAVARAMIRRSAGAGRTYRKPGGGSYRASAPGQAPVSRTGALAKSLKLRPFKNGDGIAIRDSQFYATILESGFTGGGRSGGKLSSITKARRSGKKQRRMSAARAMKPRPFLTAALSQRAEGIEQRLKRAVIEGGKFERLKA